MLVIEIFNWVARFMWKFIHIFNFFCTNGFEWLFYRCMMKSTFWWLWVMILFLVLEHVYFSMQIL